VSKPLPKGPCVLLVEDDDAVRRSLQLLLKSHGYDVRAYSSAVGLAQQPEALRCCCMIADLMMPQTDAIELLGELRAVGWDGKSILISGYLDRGWETKALAAGYDRVFHKPISETVLVRAVKELLPASQPAILRSAP
jgi:two-component system, LuxR family, response regulator FixJ